MSHYVLLRKYYMLSSIHIQTLLIKEKGRKVNMNYLDSSV